MTLRDDLLPVLQAARQKVADLGLHTHRVIVRSRAWSGGKIQTGSPVVTDLEILPRPHVKGVAGDPVLQIGPVMPAYSGVASGGYTTAQLNHADLPDTEWFYAVIGPDGVERPYKLMQLDATRPMRYMLSLTALDRRVPF